MQKKVKELVKHPLISGSAVIFIGSFAANIFNYLFNLLMGRYLSVADYGLMTALSSIFILIGVFQISSSAVFAKFVGRYFAVEIKGFKQFFTFGSKFIVIFSIITLAVLAFSIYPIAAFLHISNVWYIAIIELSIFFSLLYSLPAGIFQGGMKFYTYSVLTIIQSLLKFTIGVGLVLIGFKLYGALFGILSSVFFAFMIGYIYIYKSYIAKDKENIREGSHFEGFYKFFLAYLISSVGMTLLSNTDILLVRHFFSDVISGQYAALSLMGKAIFYFTTPVGFVFFPLIVQKREKKERLFNTVILAVGVVGITSVVLSFVYFAFPHLILSIFFPKKEYAILSGYLGFFSLYILVFTFVSLMNSFFFSIGKTEVYKFMILAAIAQISLIFVFHSSLYQIIGILFSISIVLLSVLFVYYMRYGKD